MLSMGKDLEHHLILDALAWDGWDVGMGRWGAQVGGAGPAILGQTPTCALSGCWGLFVEGLSTHGRGKGEGGKGGRGGRGGEKREMERDRGGEREGETKNWVPALTLQSHPLHQPQYNQ